MEKLWKSIDDFSWRAGTKYRAVLLIFVLLAAFAGFVLWLIVRSMALASTDWMICFAGYPALAAFIAVCLYACRHEFHDGKNQ